MRISHRFFQTLLLLIWIPVVITIFKLIPDKIQAGQLTGTGFLFLSLILLGNEFLNPRRSRLVLASYIQFFIFFAVPIVLMRRLNPTLLFNEIVFLGIPAEAWHKGSNLSYSVMLVTLLGTWLSEKKVLWTKSRKEQEK